MNNTETWGASLGFQQMTSLATAVAPTVPAGTSVMVIQADTQNVRWRDDGTSPTASVGMLVRTTDQPYIYRGDFATIEFIQAASSAVLNISYYGTRPPA